MDKPTVILTHYLPLIIAICAGFVAMQQSNSIVGTWIDKEDLKHKWIFKADGTLIMRYEGYGDDHYTYKVSSSSPQCGVDVQSYLQQHPDVSILKLKDIENDDKTCYYIYGLNNQTLTLSPFEIGGIQIFKKTIK